MASSKKTDKVSLYAELSKAGDGIAPNAGEDKTAFLVRLTEAISTLDDATFDALSAGAQKWFNASGEAINAGALEHIPTLSGLPTIEAEPEPEPESEGDEEGQSEAKPSTKKEKVMASKAKPAVVAKKSTTSSKTSATKKTVLGAKVAASKGAGRGRKSAFADTDKITLLVKENPKRDGSQAHKTYPLYAKCGTVAGYIKAGGRRSDIAWDAGKKFIKVGA